MVERRTPSVGLAAACVALLVALHVVARSARDALFLSSFPAHELPKVMLGAALVGLPTVLASARLITRFGPGRVVVSLLVASGALHLVEWMLLARLPLVAVVVLYLHASVASGIAVSGFWSAATERFDPHAMRRVAERLSAGAAAGGLLGGLFARFFGASLGPEALLPVLTGSSLVAALAVRGFSGRSKAFHSATAPGDGVRNVTASNYLMTLATLVLLTGFSSVLVDFSFKSGVSRATWSSHDLVSFFALFYAATSVASVVLQLSVSRWVLGNLGLRTALTALPSAVVVLGLLGIALPSTWVLVLLRGSSLALETSLFRSAYEPLYGPLPVTQKRSAKPLIDVAADRAGEALGSGIALGLGALLPLFASRLVLATAVAGALVCIWLATRLERGYVAQLASSLRSGKVRLEADDVADATTRLTLSQTQLEMDRETLLRQIQELRRRPTTAGAEAPSGDVDPPPVSSDPRAQKLEARLLELRSGNVERVNAALAGEPLEPELVSLVIPLLAEEAHLEAATAALRRVGTKHAGQLLDTLLDQDRPLRLRRRIPRVLRSSAASRVVRGLAEALTDPDFEIRYRVGLALRDLIHQDQELRPPQNLVLAAARHEVDASRAAWQACSASLEADHAAETSGRVALADRALDHVFTLIGLAFDTEAVELARRALSTSDLRLRGTALEYLEHVVPEPIRSGIWPYLPAARPPGQARRRSPSEIVQELSRSFG